MSLDGGLASPGTAGPLQVLLNVYDVAQQGDGKGTVVRLNNLVGPKGLGLGGVFHGAIVLGTVEFSFGFCEQGTGVYAVKAGMNPMYTFRETVDLGATHKSMQEIRTIIQQLKQEWPGSSYDLLYRNCCHFCVDLAARLDVGPVPGWLNRFASGAAATINITQDTVKTVQEFGAEVGRFWNRTLAAASHQQQQLAEKLQQQQQQWRSGVQQQEQPHSPQQQERGSASPAAQRSSSQLAGRTSQAGQQIWSGLTQAGQQLRSTTSKLAQAAAVKSSSGGPRFGSFSLASMSLASSASQYAVAGDEDLLATQQQQHQQQRQPNGVSSWAPQAAAPVGTTTAASAAVADAAAAAAGGASQPLQSSQQGALGPADRASLLLGAQPKLSKQYRLSAGGAHPFASDAAAARAAAGSSGGGAGSRSGGGAGSRRLAPCASDDGLMPFLSVDDADPFVALFGDDDAEDDAQQQAAVEHAVHHTPEPAVSAKP